MKKKWDVSRLVCQLVEAGIGSLDIVVDGVASLPFHQPSVSKVILTLNGGDLYLSESLPITLHFGCLFSPLFANDFGYFWVGKSRMLGYDLCLVMLTVKNESYKEHQCSSLSQRVLGHVKGQMDACALKRQSNRETAKEKGAVECLPFRGLGILGSG
jgi:hypothetical protein